MTPRPQSSLVCMPTTHIDMYTHTHMQTRTPTHACTHIHIHMLTYTYTHSHILTLSHILTHALTHTHIYTHTFACTHSPLCPPCHLQPACFSCCYLNRHGVGLGVGGRKVLVYASRVACDSLCCPLTTAPAGSVHPSS